MREIVTRERSNNLVVSNCKVSFGVKQKEIERRDRGIGAM